MSNWLAQRAVNPPSSDLGGSNPSLPTMTNTTENPSRKSLKFRAKSEKSGIDTPCFGEDEADAERKFREFFNLEKSDKVEIWAVQEFNMLALRLN